MSAPAATGGAPASLKHINKFLLQAKKLDKVDPFVAYHCRMFAMQSGIAVKNKDKAAMDYLKELMMQLEQAKSIIPKLSKDDARQRLETFALNVFKHADDEDRAGKATKKTAASFLAASIFMEVCKQFGDLASDIQEKLKYAQWKAADISRAIREGVTPVPGGIENMDDLKLDENGNPIEYSSPAPQAQPQQYSGPPPQFPSAPPPHAASAPPHQQFPPAGYPAPQPTHSLPDLPSSLGLPPSVSPRASPVPYHLPSVPFTGPPAASFHPPGPAPVASGPGQLTISANRGLEKLQAILEAEKLSKHAVSALRFQDIQTAIAKFSEAIAVLLPHK